MIKITIDRNCYVDIIADGRKQINMEALNLDITICTRRYRTVDYNRILKFSQLYLRNMQDYKIITGISGQIIMEAE